MFMICNYFRLLNKTFLIEYYFLSFIVTITTIMYFTLSHYYFINFLMLNLKIDCSKEIIYFNPIIITTGLIKMVIQYFPGLIFSII